MLKEDIVRLVVKPEQFSGKIKYEDFVQAVAYTNNVAKTISCSAGTLSSLVKRLFPDKPKGRLFYYISSLTNYKHCSNCDIVKNRTEFYNNKSMTDGLNNHCKVCHSKVTANTQSFRQASYRSSKIQRTPVWADLDKIAVIYSNCPDGYHVDHIVPLNGINVCGLHVEYNLQYLTAEENIKKSNR